MRRTFVLLRSANGKNIAEFNVAFAGAPLVDSACLYTFSYSLLFLSLLRYFFPDFTFCFLLLVKHIYWEIFISCEFVVRHTAYVI